MSQSLKETAQQLKEKDNLVQEIITMVRFQQLEESANRTER